MGGSNAKQVAGRSAGGIAEEDLEMSPETTAMLRALTGGANQERLEFLG